MAKDLQKMIWILVLVTLFTAALTFASEEPDVKEGLLAFKYASLQHRGYEIDTSHILWRWAELREDSNPAEGECNKRKNEPTIIFLSRTLYPARNKWDQLVTVLHELGHCVLNREHVETIQNGRPKSLMHSRGITGKQLQEHYDEYTIELFRGEPR